MRIRTLYFVARFITWKYFRVLPSFVILFSITCRQYYQNYHLNDEVRNICSSLYMEEMAEVPGPLLGFFGHEDDMKLAFFL